MEERDPVERNAVQTAPPRTPSRNEAATWERMQRLVRMHLPRPGMIHPYRVQMTTLGPSRDKWGLGNTLANGVPCGH